MALVALPSPMLWPGDILATPFVASSTNQAAILLDAAADRIAMHFRAPKAGNLNKIGFLLGTVTTGETLLAGFQDVDITTGNPDGTFDQSGTVAVADTDDNLWKEVTTSTTRTVAVDDVVAAVIQYNAFVAGSLNIQAYTPGARATFNNSTYIDNNLTGSYAKSSSNYPIISIGYDDGTYAFLPGAYPYTSRSSTAFNNTSSPDEKCLIFSFPFACEISGLWFGLLAAAGGDFACDLYDMTSSSDTTDRAALATSATVDSDITIEASGAAAHVYFSSPQTLTKDAYYRAAIRPTGASNITAYSINLDAAALRAAWPYGTSCSYSDRTDLTGTWAAATTTSLLLAGVIISKLDDGVGGFLTNPGMSGGFHG